MYFPSPVIIDLDYLCQALGGEHEDGEGHDHGAEGGEAEDPDRDPIWKGMVVLAGIYFFFMAERGMGMYNQWKANHRKEPQVGPQQYIWCLEYLKDYIFHFLSFFTSLRYFRRARRSLEVWKRVLKSH